MKLSVAVAAEDAPSSAFVVWRGFENSIKKASQYGYQGVELALKSAWDIDPDQLQQWLIQSGMEVSCISTGQVFSCLDLYFTHPDGKVREEAVHVFNDIICLAKDFGKLVNVGRVRGFVGQGQAREEARRLFIETTQRICETAEQNGVTVIIEPVNRYELNFINSLDEGAEVISELKDGNIGLMPDLFHMNMEDDRIGKSIIRNARYIKYIHFADSNRLAPGRGHIDFKEVFDALRQIRFHGWAAIEILPEPDPDRAAQEAAKYILPLMKDYNKSLYGTGIGNLSCSQTFMG